MQAAAFGDGGQDLRRMLRADPRHEAKRGPALAPGTRRCANGRASRTRDVWPA